MGSQAESIMKNRKLTANQNRVSSSTIKQPTSLVFGRRPFSGFDLICIAIAYLILYGPPRPFTWDAHSFSTSVNKATNVAWTQWPNIGLNNVGKSPFKRKIMLSYFLKYGAKKSFGEEQILQGKDGEISDLIQFDIVVSGHKTSIFKEFLPY